MMFTKENLVHITLDVVLISVLLIYVNNKNKHVTSSLEELRTYTEEQIENVNAKLDNIIKYITKKNKPQVSQQPTNQIQNFHQAQQAQQAQQAHQVHQAQQAQQAHQVHQAQQAQQARQAQQAQQARQAQQALLEQQAQQALLEQQQAHQALLEQQQAHQALLEQQAQEALLEQQSSQVEETFESLISQEIHQPQRSVIKSQDNVKKVRFNEFENFMNNITPTITIVSNTIPSNNSQSNIEVLEDDDSDSNENNQYRGSNEQLSENDMREIEEALKGK